MEENRYEPASGKQLYYIELLCEQLNMPNKTMYERYTKQKASQDIKFLKKLLNDRKTANQVRMF